MTHIFYLLIPIFLLFEIFAYQNAERIMRKIAEFKASPKDEPKEYLSKNIDVFLYYVFNLFYACYIFIGIFSSQWILFGLFFALSIGFGQIKRRNVTMRKIDSIISFIILLFILINKYHLHINFL